jgi:hypothetical protein
MLSNASEDNECPICEREADAIVGVESGDSWGDLLGRPPHSFFQKYQMLHYVERQHGDGVLYCHKIKP